MITVSLSREDAEWATRVGRARNHPTLTNRRGYRGDGERIHVIGAAGELAFCRAARIEWPAHINTFGSKADVPPNIEVKTRLRPEYNLLLSQKDSYDPNVNAICVHVTTARNEQDETQDIQFKFLIWGWWDNSKQRDDSWVQTHGNREAAYFIPPSQLNSDFSKWGIIAEPEEFDGPDLDKFIRRFGSYSKVPASEWAIWDQQYETWQQSRRAK